jgi:hypothetical protein
MGHRLLSSAVSISSSVPIMTSDSERGFPTCFARKPPHAPFLRFSREGKTSHIKRPPKVGLTEFPPLLLVMWRDRRTLISTFANHRQYLPARGVVPIQFNRRDLRSRQLPLLRTLPSCRLIRASFARNSRSFWAAGSFLSSTNVGATCHSSCTGSFMNFHYIVGQPRQSLLGVWQ